MADRIKSRVTQLGTATEILYEFHNRSARETEGEVYYHLVDKTQTSTVRRLSNGEIVTLPYKIVFSEKIKVRGNDLATLKTNSAHAKNIAFVKSGVEEQVDTVTYTYKYFAVRNRMFKSGRRSGRRNIDTGAYRLYEKQSAAKLGLNAYTLLSEYAGDLQRLPIYAGKGEIIGYKDRPLSNNYGAGIVDVEVAIPSSGQPIYTVASNSRGDSFYINLVQPYL